MDFHPIADLFPLLAPAELAELAADIKRHGVLDPLITHEGMILDGRNRWLAISQLLAAGHTPHYRTEELWEGEDPIAFVVSKNLRRRHLTPGQRAMAATTAEEMYAKLAHPGRPKKTVDHGPGFSPGLAREKAGQLFGVTGRSVGDAKAVKVSAIPELKAAVESGTLGVRQAARLAKLPPEEQRKALSKPEKPRKKARPRLLKISDARKFASMAISQLERIPPDDPERLSELNRVKYWIEKQMRVRGAV